MPNRYKVDRNVYSESIKYEKRKKEIAYDREEVPENQTRVDRWPDGERERERPVSESTENESRNDLDWYKLKAVGTVCGAERYSEGCRVSLVKAWPGCRKLRDVSVNNVVMAPNGSRLICSGNDLIHIQEDFS